MKMQSIRLEKLLKRPGRAFGTRFRGEYRAE